MYSALPALVGVIFLCYGVYALVDQGFTRISSSLFMLCLSTFCWQFGWALLFQVNEPDLAMIIIKFVYLMIIFLPTHVYHFLAEICGLQQERRYVYISYGFSALLAVFLLGSDLFISGYYQYFWGYYPKAGVLHPIHVLQTTALAIRSFYITYHAQKNAFSNRRVQIRLCFTVLFFFFLSGFDYLCNYGLEFYPPGVIFIAFSLGLFTVAITKYNLLDPAKIAASVAHEIRTPLATIRIQAAAIAQYWPILFEGYQLAVQHGLCEKRIHAYHLPILANLTERITREVDRSNMIIDMMLASTSLEQPDALLFKQHSLKSCVEEALERYPFDDGARNKLEVTLSEDFSFHGSNILLVSVLFNLLKNALYALQSTARGKISIRAIRAKPYNQLIFTDSGPGIPAVDSGQNPRKNGAAF